MKNRIDIDVEIPYEEFVDSIRKEFPSVEDGSKRRKVKTKPV